MRICKKELEAEEMIGNKLGYLNALKDVLKLIDEVIELSDKNADLWGLEELKARIEGC